MKSSNNKYQFLSKNAKQLAKLYIFAKVKQNLNCFVKQCGGWAKAFIQVEQKEKEKPFFDKNII